MVGRDGGVMLLCTAREGQSHLEVFCCLRDLRLFSKIREPCGRLGLSSYSPESVVLVDPDNLS